MKNSWHFKVLMILEEFSCLFYFLPSVPLFSDFFHSLGNLVSLTLNIRPKFCKTTQIWLRRYTRSVWYNKTRFTNSWDRIPRNNAIWLYSVDSFFVLRELQSPELLWQARENFGFPQVCRQYITNERSIPMRSSQIETGKREA